MNWFEAHATRLQVELDIPAHAICRRYTDFLLRSVYTEPWPVLLAILFAVEASYLAAWGALPPSGPYAEFTFYASRLRRPGFLGGAPTLGPKNARMSAAISQPSQCAVAPEIRAARVAVRWTRARKRCSSFIPDLCSLTDFAVAAPVAPALRWANLTSCSARCAASSAIWTKTKTAPLWRRRR